MKIKSVSLFFAWALALIAFFSSTSFAASRIVITRSSDSPRRTAFRSSDSFRVISVFNVTNTGDTAGELDFIQITKPGLNRIFAEIDGNIYFSEESQNYQVGIGFPRILIQPGRVMNIVLRGNITPGANEATAYIDGFGGYFDRGENPREPTIYHAVVDELQTEGIGNVSIRAMVSPTQMPIMGFVVKGDPQHGYPVLVRVAGPSLRRLGVTNFLADPLMKVFQGNHLITENDDWQGLQEVFARVGAFPFDQGSFDSAVLLWLTPGNYTAQVKPFGTGQGEVVIEAYQLPVPFGAKG